MKKVELSVVIPAYNEALRIVPTLARIREYLAASGLPYEVVVVDDGSTDETAAAVGEAMGRMPHMRLLENPENRGKGYSFRRGFLESVGRFVLLSDADLSTPIEELERFLPEMGRGADIVIGSRALRGARIEKRQPVYRVLMGKTFNKVVRVLAVSGVADTQCGFKLFRRESCLRLVEAQKAERFSFDVELLFLARRRELRIVELPVTWVNSPASKVRVVRDSLRMLADVARMRLDYLAGRYPGL